MILWDGEKYSVLITSNFDDSDVKTYEDYSNPDCEAGDINLLNFP
jgi:hypothetical protein